MRKLAFWLTIGLVFTVPWEAAIQVSGVGRVSRALGLVAAAVWAVSVVVRGRIRKPDAFMKAFFLFLVWNGFTLFWSIDPNATIDGFLTYTQIFAMLLMIWDLFTSERQIEVALQAFVFGAYVSCVSILVNYLTASTSKNPEYQRINALGFEVDGIAIIIALGVPAAWYLATGPTVWRRSNAMLAANFVYVPTAILAIILTGTRGAALASVPSVVFILWALRKASPARRIAASVMVVVAVMAVFWVAPSGPLDRIAGSVADVAGGDSLSGRREIWGEALEVFFDNSIVGIGLDANRAASTAGKETHNTVLSVLVETGLVGFVFSGIVVVTVLGRAWQRTGWAAWYWGTQLAVIGLGSMSLSLEDRKAVWIFFCLCVVSAVALKTQQAELNSKNAMVHQAQPVATAGEAATGQSYPLR